MSAAIALVDDTHDRADFSCCRLQPKAFALPTPPVGSKSLRGFYLRRPIPPTPTRPTPTLPTPTRPTPMPPR